MKSLTIIFTLLLTSCHPIYCGWSSDYDNVINPPEREKIVGSYVLSKDSQEFLERDFTNWPINLSLSNDGQYRFFNQLENYLKQGKWSLYCDGKSDCAMELEGITVECLGIKGSDIALLITLGDGDECEGIVYEKAK